MLDVVDLRAAYGRLEVLHGVSLRVDPAKVVALVGANGAGKTTLLRAVSGLLAPSGGRVVVDGEDVTGWRAERVAGHGVAHVPENRLVFPGLTVADNLALGARPRGRVPAREVAADREKVLALFPRLADRLGQAAGTLSGGEQQMLAIGRGLMGRPKLLLLDEPSLGLAPRAVGEIFAALARLRDTERVPALLVEQNVRAALRVANRVLVADRGRIVLEGTPDELADDPRVAFAYLGRVGEGSRSRPREDVP